ncbi:DDT domain-containing protein DDR4-like [Ananas comosus]|uniref:DDT domain-containing protein DDR4-like n=1 Tax=Ananas comosus TaxID=4615 RepID=A0A6P5FWG7_ANACO|nr:DDT domain-containing protein DDR4-like [Ananas comosus]
MAEKRAKRSVASHAIPEEDVVVLDDSSPSPPHHSGSQIARLQLRRRWELASVLNFLHVFEPLIQSDLKISAEEIEMALISPNDALAQLHIALLKGIPPVHRSLTESGAWVTATCKKLAEWWPWVAEGENPLKADHGREITLYGQLDPETRLLMLKALCEVRTEQDDVLRYITDELKTGTAVSTFRKERIASDGNGTTYWYDGDPVIGHRLYKEEVKTNFKQDWRAKGTLPANDFQWETIATDLKEFREISENLSSSMVSAEAAVGEIVKVEIIPLLEEVQKKKERAFKRQQKQAMLLYNSQSSHGIRTFRCRRQRRPVNYTFDDFDRSISEAIEISKKSQSDRLHKDAGKQAHHVSTKKSKPSNAALSLDEVNSSPEHDGVDADDDNKHEEIINRDNDGDDDDNDDCDDGDYNENDDNHVENDDDNDDSHPSDSNEEKNVLPARSKLAGHNRLSTKPKANIVLRRSRRNATKSDHIECQGEVISDAETKKLLRQRPTTESDFGGDTVVSDSENERPDYEHIVVSDTEDGISVSSDGSMEAYK